MKTKNILSKTRIVKGALVVLGLCIAIPFSLGIYAGYTEKVGTTRAIKDALQNECNCNAIDIAFTAYGLQFSKEDGVTGEEAVYILKDCELSTTAWEETDRFNKLFLKQIEGYASLDALQFHFNKGDLTEVVVVKKGVVQY